MIVQKGKQILGTEPREVAYWSVLSYARRAVEAIQRFEVRGTVYADSSQKFTIRLIKHIPGEVLLMVEAMLVISSFRLIFATERPCGCQLLHVLRFISDLSLRASIDRSGLPVHVSFARLCAPFTLFFHASKPTPTVLRQTNAQIRDHKALFSGPRINDCCSWHGLLPGCSNSGWLLSVCT